MKKFFILFIALALMPNILFSQTKGSNPQQDKALYESLHNDYQVGYFSRAESTLDELLKIDSLNPNLLVYKALIEKNYHKDFNKAYKFLDKILSFDSNNLLAIKNKTIFLTEEKKVNAVSDLLDKLAPELWDHELVILLSNAIISLNTIESKSVAKSVIKQYIADFGELPIYVRQLAAIYNFTDTDSSILWYRRCISLEPNNQINYDQLAVTYLSQDKKKDAINILNHGINKCMVNDALYFRLAKINFELEKNIPSALMNLEKAISIEKYEEYFIFRAEVYDSIGRNDLAYADYHALLTARPWNASYLKAVASHEFDGKLYGKAISTIENSAKYDNSLLDSCAKILMKAYFAKGDFNNAYKYIYKRRITASKDFYDIYIRALLISSNGRYDEGIKICEGLMQDVSKLNQEQEFSTSVLYGLLLFVLEKDDQSYAVFDKLYSKYGNRFLSSTFIKPITNEEEKKSKRKIILESKGGAEFTIYVNMNTSEYDSFKKRYNMKD